MNKIMTDFMKELGEITNSKIDQYNFVSSLSAVCLMILAEEESYLPYTDRIKCMAKYHYDWMRGVKYTQVENSVDHIDIEIDLKNIKGNL